MPCEDPLVENRLLGFGEFPRNEATFLRGPLGHAGNHGILGGASAEVARTAEHKDSYSKLVEGGCLLVNLIRNGSVRSWTVDQDVDGISVVGGHRLVFCGQKKDVLSSGLSPFFMPRGLFGSARVLENAFPLSAGQVKFAFSARIHGSGHPCGIKVPGSSA